MIISMFNFFIFLFFLLLIFLLNKINISKNIKLLFYFTILLESVNLIFFFYNKFPLVFSFGMALILIYLIMDILSLDSKNDYNKNMFSFVLVIEKSIKNVGPKMNLVYVFIGFLILISSFVAEWYIYDHKGISFNFILLMFIALSWLLYPFFPDHYLHLRNFSFIIFNLLFLIIIIPKVLDDFLSITLPNELVLLTFMVWISYIFIPDKFILEKNFILIFVTSLTFLFELTPLLFNISKSLIDIDSEPLINQEVIIYIFLTKPLATLLSLLGYSIISSGEYLYYENLELGVLSSVHIATQCSGINSVILFMSAFTSYIIVFERFTKLDTFILFSVGFLLSYISNLFRMAIVILVGHYFGIEAMLSTHSNLGWLLFLAWMSLFWYILSKFSFNSINKS